jgi:hypothetical protein
MATDAAGMQYAFNLNEGNFGCGDPVSATQRGASFSGANHRKEPLHDACCAKKIFPTLDNLKYLDKHYVIDIANNNSE